MAQIGTTAADNGSYPDGGISLHPGRKTVAVDGVYGGASVALQISFDGGTTWHTIHTFTSAATEPKSVEYTGGLLQFLVSNAGASTSLSFYIV